MTIVEVYSKKDCNLCDDAKEVLKTIQRQHPFELREILLQEGDGGFEEFRKRFPVVFINKVFAFQYRVPAKAFISTLESVSEKDE